MVQREKFTFAELEQWLNTHRVTEIECLVPDLTGEARGKSMPREKLIAFTAQAMSAAIAASARS